MFFFLAEKRNYSKLDTFLIYFDTATFDQIQKDTKIKMETMVGVVGGTMGLFTGFSILSGVEIFYFIVKFFFSFINKKVNKNVYINQLTVTLFRQTGDAHQLCQARR